MLQELRYLKQVQLKMNNSDNSDSAYFIDQYVQPTPVPIPIVYSLTSPVHEPYVPSAGGVVQTPKLPTTTWTQSDLLQFFHDHCKRVTASEFSRELMEREVLVIPDRELCAILLAHWSKVSNNQRVQLNSNSNKN